MSGHTIVVGGTRGIGRAIARRFAQDGGQVITVGRSDTDEPRQAGVRVAALDVADRGLGDRVGELLRDASPLHNVIFAQRFRGTSDPWIGEWETSLSATRTIVEAAASAFAPDGPRSIVIVCSVAHQVIALEQPVSYHVAKGALRQLVRYYAVTLGRQRIRVNSISTGTVVKDESTSYYERNPELVDLHRRVVPLGRMAVADDVAGVARFLCGPDASFLTGHDIILDGGLSALGHESVARRAVGLL